MNRLRLYTVCMMDDNGRNVRPVFYWLNLNEKVINLDELVLMISFLVRFKSIFQSENRFMSLVLAKNIQ